MRAGLLLLAGLSLASAGSQLQRRQLRSETPALKSRQSSLYPDYTIDQPIDHFPNDARYAPHTNATFKQRYVYDSTYYKAGGPVYLYISGETSIESRLSNLRTGIIQILMEATNGLGVIIENRYYGDSYPYQNLTTDNLVYLSNEQTIADFAYFAQHAVYPGLNATLTAPSTPYIMYGGSLAGAQTSMTVKTYGDIIYGGIAASGVIGAAVTYPEWYDPVQKYGPSDCISSINDIVDKFDGLVAANNTAAVAELKAIFGLESLADDRDFAKTIAYPVGGPFDYPTETWQELIWDDNEATFWQFCSNVTNEDASDDITAVDTQLAQYTNGEAWTNLGNYASYVKDVILPTCSSGNYAGGECFGQGNGKFTHTLTEILRSLQKMLTQSKISHILDRARRLRNALVPLYDLHRRRPLPSRAHQRQNAPIACHDRLVHARDVRARVPRGQLQHHTRDARRGHLELVRRAEPHGGAACVHRRRARRVAGRVLPCQQPAGAQRRGAVSDC